ncbi:LamG domain-containing protein [Halorubrum distributum]|uniref:LamG domain-containing protein n=1 Tax=Halorubrum distributum TaxID=29283 RepID=UPI002953E588|nr:LamG domain-containing protein [Halorubrum distributum]MDV7350877.1 LamG domain-containing protein [Halorubrum distributum]
MERRKFILAIGGIASTGAAVGSGAFSSVEATRDVSVSVAADASAYLAMEPLDSPNGNQFASTDGDVLALDFSDSGNDGSGLGTDSVYNFDKVFQIVNQGTQGVYVWATFGGSSDGFDVGDTDTDIWLYPNGDPDDKLRDSEDDVLYLPTGSSADIGVYVDTHDLDIDDDQELTMTVRADVNNPAQGDVVGGGGTVVEGPADGLVSYWPLDDVESGTAVDAVGTNDGTVEGVSSVDGKVGNAGAFDGSDDYVGIPDDPSLDLTESLSLAAWVKPASGQEGYERIISREKAGGGNRQYNIGLDQSATEPRTVVDTTAEDGVEVSGAISVTDGKWHHVAMTFESGDAVRLYLDGGKVDETSVGAGDTLVSRSSQVVLGAPAQLTKLFFEGRIDDARIYDRALSETEVSDLFAKTDA